MHCCVNAPRWCLSTGGYHEQPYCEFALAFCSSADSSPVRNVMLAVCNWLRSTVMFVCWLLEIATEVSFFRPNGKRNKIMYEVAYWAYWNHPESHGRLGYTCYWEDVFWCFLHVATWLEILKGSPTRDRGKCTCETWFILVCSAWRPGCSFWFGLLCLWITGWFVKYELNVIKLDPAFEVPNFGIPSSHPVPSRHDFMALTQKRSCCPSRRGIRNCFGLKILCQP